MEKFRIHFTDKGFYKKYLAIVPLDGSKKGIIIKDVFVEPIFDDKDVCIEKIEQVKDIKFVIESVEGETYYGTRLISWEEPIFYFSKTGSSFNVSLSLKDMYFLKEKESFIPPLDFKICVDNKEIVSYKDLSTIELGILKPFTYGIVDNNISFYNFVVTEKQSLKDVIKVYTNEDGKKLLSFEVTDPDSKKHLQIYLKQFDKVEKIIVSNNNNELNVYFDCRLIDILENSTRLFSIDNKVIKYENIFQAFFPKHDSSFKKYSEDQIAQNFYREYVSSFDKIRNDFKDKSIDELYNLYEFTLNERYEIEESMEHPFSKSIERSIFGKEKALKKVYFNILKKLKKYTLNEFKESN